MAETVRTVRVEELEEFMRLLERCYGHSKGFFGRAYPHLYRPDARACGCCYVVERDGVIVSHVGVFPITIQVAGVSVSLGGIGGVATLPDQRGKGYMSRLLHHAIEAMRDKGYVASGLGGDRQRYNTFGWELAGLAYHLSFSRRSLERAKVEPVEIEEKKPAEAVETVARFHPRQACYADRPDLALQLSSQGLRLWEAEDGYVIAAGEAGADPSIVEVVSTSGREAGMVRAVMDWTFASRARYERLSACDEQRLARLVPAASWWTAGSDWMYRIVDLGGLLAACKPVLDQRAAGLRDFDVCLGIREHDRLDAATIAVREGSVEISAGRESQTCIEMDSVAAARLILGGPAGVFLEGIPPGLRALLPVPIHVPPLDHV